VTHAAVVPVGLGLVGEGDGDVWVGLGDGEVGLGLGDGLPVTACPAHCTGVAVAAHEGVRVTCTLPSFPEARQPANVTSEYVPAASAYPPAAATSTAAAAAASHSLRMRTAFRDFVSSQVSDNERMGIIEYRDRPG
jgi:hypothetical protein